MSCSRSMLNHNMISVCVHKGTSPATPLAHVRKREKIYVERARWASLVDEETCQRKSLEMAAGASSSIPVSGERSLTNGIEVDVENTKDDPSYYPVSSEKPNPAVCCEFFGAMRHRIA